MTFLYGGVLNASLYGSPVHVIRTYLSVFRRFTAYRYDLNSTRTQNSSCDL
jgi:hypothetical protein